MPGDVLVGRFARLAVERGGPLPCCGLRLVRGGLLLGRKATDLPALALAARAYDDPVRLSIEQPPAALAPGAGLLCDEGEGEGVVDEVPRVGPRAGLFGCALVAREPRPHHGSVALDDRRAAEPAVLAVDGQQVAVHVRVPAPVAGAVAAIEDGRVERGGEGRRVRVVGDQACSHGGLLRTGRVGWGRRTPCRACGPRPSSGSRPRRRRPRCSHNRRRSGRGRPGCATTAPSARRRRTGA